MLQPVVLRLRKIKKRTARRLDDLNARIQLAQIAFQESAPYQWAYGKLQVTKTWPRSGKITLVAGTQIAAFGGMFVLGIFILPLRALAIITAFWSLVVKAVGQPHQARKLWHARSAHEISLVKAALEAISYMCWLTYGVRLHDATIIWAQGAGVFGAVVILNLVAGFVIARPRTEFGHYVGDNCSDCAYVIEFARTYSKGIHVPRSKWPKRCPLCGKWFHALEFSLFDDGNSTFHAQPNIRARCEGCHRKIRIKVDKWELPEDWSGLYFYVYDTAIDEPGTCRRVSFADWMAFEAFIFRHSSERPSRLGVPSHTFLTVDITGTKDESGRILAAAVTRNDLGDWATLVEVTKDRFTVLPEPVKWAVEAARPPARFAGLHCLWARNAKLLML